MEDETRSNLEISRLVKKTAATARIKPSFYKNMGQVLNLHMEVININPSTFLTT